MNLVALGFNFLNCSRFGLFPAILPGGHRLHVGDVERHQARADGCVELGALFQLIGEERRQTEARGEHNDAEE